MVALRAVRVGGLAMHWGGVGRGGWWARRLVAFVAFVAAAAAGVVLALVLVSGAVVQRAAAADRAARDVGGAVALSRLQSLPVGAQSVISAALGSAAPGFIARRSGLGYRLQGGGVLARLGAREVDLRAGGVSLSLAFVGLGRGGRLNRQGLVSLSGRVNRARYDRGQLHEWYVAGPLGIEQGFTLARRPAGAGASVSLALGLAGSARAHQAGSGVRFLTRSGAVALRYEGLSVIDASGRPLRAAVLLHGARLLLRVWDRGARYPVRIDPLIQQGAKLTGSGETGTGFLGLSVALSADGNTALIGAPGDNGWIGAAWVFTRSGSTWAQQGPKLTGSGEIADPLGSFGDSVALSADGNTALIGGPEDNSGVGAAWVFTRSGSSWAQQGPKLTATDESTVPTRPELAWGAFGASVALSADGNTAVIGGPGDADITHLPEPDGRSTYQAGDGAAWVFARSGWSWTQQGPKLIVTAGNDPSVRLPPIYPLVHRILQAGFGDSVALSADGNTALIGAAGACVGSSPTACGACWWIPGPTYPGQPVQDWVPNCPTGTTRVGAAWVFTRSGSTWTQQGARLTGSGETGAGGFGDSVALSADGNTALIGGPFDNPSASPTGVGAAWVLTRSGSTWTQQGAKLTATDETGAGKFGTSVALSADGNIALIGGAADNPIDWGIGAGAAWVLTRSGSTWTQQGAKLTATGETGAGDFGGGVALSADANTAVIAGQDDNSRVGAAWVFTRSGGTTTTPGGTTTTPGGGHGGVAGVTTFVRKPFVTHGSEVSFALRCAHATCHDHATETLAETLKGKRIASISAADHGRGARVVKKTVTVASVTITIAAGVTRKVTLKLNKAGRNLLARFGRLPIHLTLTQRQANGKLKTIKSVKLNLKRTPAKKRKH